MLLLAGTISVSLIVMQGVIREKGAHRPIQDYSIKVQKISPAIHFTFLFTIIIISYSGSDVLSIIVYLIRMAHFALMKMLILMNFVAGIFILSSTLQNNYNDVENSGEKTISFAYLEKKVYTPCVT